MIALSDYTISTPEDGRLHYRAVKGNQTLQGRYYQNMRTRAKNPNYKALYPTYKDVSITPFMEDFQLLHQNLYNFHYHPTLRETQNAIQMHCYK